MKRHVRVDLYRHAACPIDQCCRIGGSQRVVELSLDVVPMAFGRTLLWAKSYNQANYE